MAKQQSGEFSLEEAIRRRDAVIKRMLNTPPKPHSEMKIGKSKRKPIRSPGAQKKKALPKRG
jgi:hypothetical protein